MANDSSLTRMMRPEHGGIVWSKAGAASLDQLSLFVPADVNDAAYPPAPEVLAVLRDALDYIQWAPETWADGLREALADYHRLPIHHLVVDGGASPILEHVISTLATPGSDVVILAPTYSEYPALALRSNATPVEVPLRPEMEFRIRPEDLLARVGSRTSLVVIGNPNNPTGTCMTRAEILSLLRQLPANVALVVDEVYVDYAPEVSVLADAPDWDRLCVVRSFSKAFALAGLRVGYAAVGNSVRSAWDKRGELPWRVGLLGDVAARAALQHVGYVRNMVAETRQLCETLRTTLAAEVGCITYPTRTHFFMLQPPRPGDRQYWANQLVNSGVAIRGIRWADADERHPFFRITTRSARENARIVAALKTWR